MSFPPGLGGMPPWVTADKDFARWFAVLAGRVLNACDFIVAGDSYRFAEIEVYCHGDRHPDPFVHRDRLQRENGRWYFHRTGRGFRSGSFKGLDITLGDGTSYFGVLVRSIVQPDGELIEGPSVLVDHLLARLKTRDVAVLDAATAGRSIWDAASPLSIQEAVTPRSSQVFQSSRVGLSLKKAAGNPDASKFVGRAYRFLTEPRAISKGRPHLVLALHQKGMAPEAIHTLTACPKRVIAGYIECFTIGRADHWDRYVGRDLSTGSLCGMLGLWAAHYGE